MDTKSLIIGISSFIAGGLLVSVAAVTFDKPEPEHSDSKTMTAMTESLRNKKGDAYDQAFITEMIAHHKGALEMAKLSKDQAKHHEIKELSQDIIDAQKKEIGEMKQWQKHWGYNKQHE